MTDEAMLGPPSSAAVASQLLSCWDHHPPLLVAGQLLACLDHHPLLLVACHVGTTILLCFGWSATAMLGPTCSTTGGLSAAATFGPSSSTADDTFFHSLNSHVASMTFIPSFVRLSKFDHDRVNFHMIVMYVFCPTLPNNS